MTPIEVHIANDWTEIVAPAGAILGVLVGGFLARGRERRLDRRALRHACRLLYMETVMVEVALERSRNKLSSERETRVRALISTWDLHHKALASMGFLHWNQIQRTMLGLRAYEQAGVMPRPGPRLDELIREVVSGRKILQRYVAGPLEYPRFLLWAYKQSRAARTTQLMTGVGASNGDP